MTTGEPHSNPIMTVIISFTSRRCLYLSDDTSQADCPYCLMSAAGEVNMLICHTMCNCVTCCGLPNYQRKKTLKKNSPDWHFV